MSDAPIRIVVDGFAKPRREPEAAIVPPLPKGMRERHHVRFYTPADTRKWQLDVHRLASEQMKGRIPLAGMVELDIAIYLPIPKSMRKKDIPLALRGVLCPITRPDCSNYTKGIEDALKGVAYLDDSQVVRLLVAKFYSEKPRVEIEVRQRAIISEQMEFAS